jgi:hypothetical protein
MNGEIPNLWIYLMMFKDGYSHETPLKKGIASEARGGPAACGNGGGGEETRAAANVPRRVILSCFFPIHVD